MVRSDLLALAEYLGEAAANDPLAAVLLLIGNILLVFSLGVFGLLSLGALLSVLRPH